MHLEQEIIQRVSASKNRSLSSFLNVYDSCLKQYQISPTSNDAMQLYASLINKFISNNFSAKEEMDPNLFSFGKKKYKDCEKQIVDQIKKKKLKFQCPTKQIKYLKKVDNKNVVTNNRQNHVRTNSLSRSEQRQENTKRREDKNKKFSTTNTVDETEKTFQSIQRDQSQDELKALISLQIKSRWFQTFKQSCKLNKKDNLINLHNLTLNYSLKQRRKRNMIRSLVLNYTRTLKQYQDLTFVSNYHFKRIYLSQIVDRYRIRVIRKSQLQIKSQQVSKYNFIERFRLNKNDKLVEQITKRQQQNISHMFQHSFKRYALKILFKKTQSNEFEVQALDDKLNLLKKQLVFKLMRSNMIQKAKIDSIRNEWISNNSSKKLQIILQLAESLIYLLPERKERQRQLTQYKTWCQKSDLQQVLLHFKLEKSYFKLTQYFQEIGVKIKCLEAMRKNTYFQRLQNKTSQKVKMTVKSFTLSKQLENIKKQTFLENLSQNCSFLLKCKYLSMLRKRISFRVFTDKLINYLMNKSYKKKLNYETQRYKYIITIKRYFHSLKFAAIHQKYQKSLLARMCKIIGNQIKRAVFELIKQQSIANTISWMKSKQLSRIKIKRMKQRFYQCLKISHNQKDQQIRQATILHNCFNTWKVVTLLKKEEMLFQRSLENDLKINKMRQIFQVIKQNKLMNNKRKLKFAVIENSYQQQLKRAALGLLIKGSIKTIKVLTFVNTFDLMVKRKTLRKLKDHQKQNHKPNTQYRR